MSAPTQSDIESAQACYGSFHAQCDTMNEADLTAALGNTLARIKVLEDALRATICHGCNNQIGWNGPPAEDSPYRNWQKCFSCKAARAALNPVVPEEITGEPV